ncbi:MAG: J domain-containing protein, partial [Candidatus Binatia bacterium]
MDDIDRAYATLGLEPGAPPERVKQAYRDLVNVWHPDRFAHNGRLQTTAQEKLRDINRAYDRLEAFFRDPERASRTSQPHPEPERERYESPEPEKAPDTGQAEKKGHNPFEEYFGVPLR